MIDIFQHTLIITFFIVNMMLLIECLHIWTRGRWEAGLRGKPALQKGLGVSLGALPGCLGSFTVVTLFVHQLVSMGTLAACMLATTGDAAFLMLALFPEQALGLFGILVILGICTGIFVDRFLPRAELPMAQDDHALELHHEEDLQEGIHWKQVRSNWRKPLPLRVLLVTVLGVILIGLLLGETQHAHEVSWNAAEVMHRDQGDTLQQLARVHEHSPAWVHATLIGVFVLGLLLLATVSDHFLEKHLWEHVVVRHVPRLFCWIGLTLVCIYFLSRVWDLHLLVSENRMLMLLVACAIGWIPDSSPQVICVTLYATGVLPFPILLCNCIVQDGHGMLPVLAHSRRVFVQIKLLHSLIGLSLGGLGLLLMGSG